MVERILFGPGGATEAKQDTQETTLLDILAALGATITVDGEVALDAATLAALENITVTGTVGVNNFPAVQPVSDNGGSLTVDGTVAVSNFPATQPVSGPLTDTQLRATPVPVAMSSDIEIGAVELKNGTDDTRATVTASNALKVDGSAVTQPVSDGGGSLTVDGSVVVSSVGGSVAVTGPLTDVQLRATPVPVSGTVTTGGLTDVQLRATPVPVAESTGLVPKVFDFIDLNYTGDDVTQAVYKQGGSGGTTVATLTLSYSAPGVLDTVTRT